jgi:hypothetical protein
MQELISCLKMTDATFVGKLNMEYRLREAPFVKDPDITSRSIRKDIAEMAIKCLLWNFLTSSTGIRESSKPS